MSGNRLTFWEMDADSVLATRPEAAKHEWEGEGEAAIRRFDGEGRRRACLPDGARERSRCVAAGTDLRSERRTESRGIRTYRQEAAEPGLLVHRSRDSAECPRPAVRVRGGCRSGMGQGSPADPRTPTDGVDPDAVATGPLAEAFCTEMAKYTGKRAVRTTRSPRWFGAPLAVRQSIRPYSHPVVSKSKSASEKSLRNSKPLGRSWRTVMGVSLPPIR